MGSRRRAAFWCLVVLLGCAWASAAWSQPTPRATGLVFCYQGKVADPFVVVVDKSRQRLVVFKYLGQPVVDYELPCATGEREGNKQRAGDERTPEGIYFITHRYRDRKVTIFGDRALHLNYPNACDRAESRGGDGIYIHGTNRPLRPRSTNGCIALDNRDLSLLDSLVRDHSTPVIVMDRLSVAPWPRWAEACRQLERIVRAGAWHQGPGRIMLKGLAQLPRSVQALAGLGQVLGRVKGLKLVPKGWALYGAGKQWVVVTRGWLVGPGGKRVGFIYRQYMLPADHGGFKVVGGTWVLPGVKALKLVARWVPRQLPPAKPAPVPATQQAIAQIREMLDGWLKAWEAKDLKKYMSYYAKDFRSASGMNRAQWAAHKAYLNRVYRRIRVKARRIRITLVQPDKAKVRFVQYYRSDWHRDVGIKELTLVKRNGRWLIVAESWRRLRRGR